MLVKCLGESAKEFRKWQADLMLKLKGSIRWQRLELQLQLRSWRQVNTEWQTLTMWYAVLHCILTQQGLTDAFIAIWQSAKHFKLSLAESIWVSGCKFVTLTCWVSIVCIMTVMAISETLLNITRVFAALLSSLLCCYCVVHDDKVEAQRADQQGFRTDVLSRGHPETDWAKCSWWMITWNAGVVTWRPSVSEPILSVQIVWYVMIVSAWCMTNSYKAAKAAITTDDSARSWHWLHAVVQIGHCCVEQVTRASTLLLWEWRAQHDWVGVHNIMSCTHC